MSHRPLTIFDLLFPIRLIVYAGPPSQNLSMSIAGGDQGQSTVVSIEQRSECVAVQ